MEFKCQKCGYIQDFDPSDTEKMRVVFPEFQDIKANQCPACREEDAF